MTSRQQIPDAVASDLDVDPNDRVLHHAVSMSDVVDAWLAEP